MNGNLPLLAVGSGARLWWPSPLPSANLDYALNVGPELTADNDTIASILLQIAPSGTGELQALSLQPNGNIIVVQLSGGVAGRVYRVRVLVTGASGNEYPWLVYKLVDPSDAVPPPPFWMPPPPPNPGYGTPVTWTSGETPYIFPPSLAGAPATNLILTSPPLLIASQTNIIASAPPGTAAILPTNVIGTIFIQNNDPTNNAPINPPPGWQINALGLNEPFIIGGNGGRISFVTNGISSQYWAG